MPSLTLHGQQFHYFGVFSPHRSTAFSTDASLAASQAGRGQEPIQLPASTSLKEQIATAGAVWTSESTNADAQPD